MIEREDGFSNQDLTELSQKRFSRAFAATEWLRPPRHRVASEEIFGPVLSVMTFRAPEEAFKRANNMTYGLSAAVWMNKLIFKMAMMV